MICPSVPIDGGYLSAILAFVDCQAQQMGAAGYQALAAPGSTFSIILAVLLTVFVALFGYRMMLGHVPSVREGVMAFVKIGIVLTLATSWPPYQTLVYNTVFKGPAELTASIGGASGLPGAQGGMVARLENTDRMLMSLAVNGAGFPQTTEQAAQRTPPVLPGFDALALARIFYLAGIVGAFASVRILAGLLLALAPFFVAFLLFEGTRGLFEGWLRALLGAALGALGVAIVLGIELAILETWLSNILAARASRVSVPNAPVELLVTTATFAVVLGAMLFALARVAMGFRLGAILNWTASVAGTAPKDTSEARPNADSTSEPVVARSRAIAISDAVAASQRREEQVPAGTIPGASRVPIEAANRDITPPPPTPLGHTFRRRATSRVSASAGRRDQR